MTATIIVFLTACLLLAVLAARRRRLSRILSSIEDGLLAFDKQARLVFANEAGSHIIRTAGADLSASLETAARESATGGLEYFHGALNRWFDVQSYGRRDGGVAVVARDVTASRRLQNALRAGEERFQKLMDSGVLGVFVTDREFITEANAAFLAMTGYTKDDVMKRQARWKDIAGGFELERAVGDGVKTPVEIDLIRRGGRPVPALMMAIPVSDAPLEVIGLVIDLTQRMLALRRMQGIADASRILESSLDYEKTFNELAKFMAANFCEHCAIFTYEDNEFHQIAAARSDAARVPFADAINTDVMKRVLRSGRSEWAPSRAGAPVSAIVPGPGRSKIACVLVLTGVQRTRQDGPDMNLFEEIGRRAGLALEHARLYESVQEASRLKDEFVAMVSHELRTPLTPILGAVYMVRNDPGNMTILHRSLDLIERNAKAQSKIVEDLLDVSRIISGKLRLNMETVDLHAVVSAAAETVRPASEAKNIAMELSLRPLRGVVYGDAGRLQQVVWNLLANSVKFTPSGGRITVDLDESGVYAQLRVSDTGVGIGPEFLPHVFDRFRQADGSQTRPHGGLGLGLAIVRHLVESHGGAIQADSSGRHKGATFTVKLPLRPTAQDAGKARAGN